MALAGSEASLALAHEAVDETGRGVVDGRRQGYQEPLRYRKCLQLN
ncbi:Alcohol-acetaldehyde dehydrogenase (fragment) [Lactobacillus delbrueckii subsp. bulgaricus]